MQVAIFEDMGKYVLNRKSKLVQYIPTQPIMKLCEETVLMLGTWVVKM